MALLDFTDAPHGGRQRHLPEWQSQPRIKPTTIVDHSIVGTGEQGFQHFLNRSVLESHFIVCGAGDVVDGEILQLMDTDRQADANLDANDFAVSIETGDRGDPDNQPWTEAQLDSLIWLHERLLAVHPTIPRQKCATWNGGGLGFHTLFGSPSHWTPTAKSCPGRVRIQQWAAMVLPAFLRPEEVLDMYDAAAELRLFKRIEEAERRAARYVDHGDAAVTGSGNHHVKILAALAALGLRLDALEELLTQPDPPTATTTPTGEP